MPGQQLTEQGIQMQVFLEEFQVLLDAGCTVVTICQKLDAKANTITTRLRRAGLTQLTQRWERRCSAAGIEA